MPDIPLKHGKKHTQKLKHVLALMSSRIGITVPQSLKCFLEVSNGFFDQQYSLTKKDALSTELCLPSVFTIRKSKHDLAILSERMCVHAILSKLPHTKVFIFYDTTSRRAIKGEWPTITVMVGEVLYRLRPLMLARETKEQIRDFLIETLKRLAILGGCSVKLIWETIYALMTDSVSKNMGIEKMTAELIESDHVPLHLICQSHFTENADRSISKALSEIEESLNLKEHILEKSPELSSFISSTPVTLACLNAVSSLINDTGRTSNLHNEWLKYLKDANKKNRFNAFRENRFAQTGRFAAATIYHWDDLKSLLCKFFIQFYSILICSLNSAIYF